MASPKSLKSLVRLSRWHVDEKRRALTTLQEREDQIVAAMEAAEKQLIEEQRLAAGDATGAGFLYGAFQRAHIDRREESQHRLAILRHQIELARDELTEAFRVLKTYEITQRERERKAREEADRKEQAFLDEVGLTIFRRREENKDGELP